MAVATSMLVCVCGKEGQAGFCWFDDLNGGDRAIAEMLLRLSVWPRCHRWCGWRRVPLNESVLHLHLFEIEGSLLLARSLSCKATSLARALE
jgi:hypothetical protein